MKTRRALVAVTLSAAVVAACQILAGIDNHDFTVDLDSAPPPDNAPPPDVPIPDPCGHKLPPPRPDAAFDETDNKYILALRTADFSGSDDAGQPIGYDIDGVCTCDFRPGSAHGGGSGCYPPAVAHLCDKEGGVDNSAYDIFKVYGPLFGKTPITSDNLPVDCGKETLLFYITQYNGKPNDDKVRVGLVASYGIRDPHDAGERIGSGCLSDPDATPSFAPFPAKWDGTDVWSFFPLSAARAGPNIIPTIVSDQAYVVDYLLVIPQVRQVPLFLFGANLLISSPLVVARLVGVDVNGNEVDGGAAEGAVAFRIAQGIVVGRIGTDALLSAVGLFKPNGQGAFVCNSVYGALAKSTVCGAVDTLVDPARDFQLDPRTDASFPCDSLSMAVRFTAEPAQIGSAYDPDAALIDACAPDWTVCPPLK